MLRIALLVMVAASLHAALTVDLDLTRLRQAPGAEGVRARLDAMLPAAAKARLAGLQALFGFDPRRDLRRVVIDVPDQGAPSIRLVGLPAEKIAQALSLRGEGVALPDGRVGYVLPNHPLALFVAIDAHEAVIGRGAALQAAPIPAAPAPSASAIAAHLAPGPHPRCDALSLARTVDLAADGAGHIELAITAVDAAGAVELERRLGVMRDMVATGADGKLPRLIDAQQVLSAATATREGEHLAVAIAVPDELRARLIGRALDRIGERLSRAGDARKAAAE